MATKNTTSQKIFKATALSCTIIVLLFAGLALYLNQVAGGEVLANMLVPGIIGVIIAVGLVLYISKRLVQTIDTPITRLKTQLKKIREGDLEARIGLKTGDDFQEIGQSIDNVIGNRFASLINIEDENETLNDSIVTLLETVAQLAQKNLTIRARVSEDMTGPIADALNMMATETAKVLNRVMAISEEVAETSNLVKTQADNVLLLADEERQEVENAAVELKTASETMANIAKLAVE
ncbi:MAG: methyl-accepting chemotaxis protein, partial [Gammaproteobacteria bacterium]